ncbi:putative anthocyanidin reductase [Impatiens glandulifera]|uniref:putative anthocyanidin reductase n=1 Tax=Impatiens glandulifera TaxID=253017 RepID=UPI001FB1757D|nr:putative anthocyanidin reductase [Impatiens glandulifera]
MEEQSNFYKVCVTGGSGFIGSCLVKKLLERGHTVHATTQNLGDESKVKVLKSLPNAETNLVLFQANIYNPDEFGPVIEGCRYVIHLATPLQHNPAGAASSSPYKDTTEAAVAGVRTIADLCSRSATVKRLIFAGSVMAASPFKEDGSGYKACNDESCWTPLHLPYSSLKNDMDLLAYVRSKTLSEKELLGYNVGELEVVSLICGLVGGDVQMLGYVPMSVRAVVGQLTGHPFSYLGLKSIQELSGSVPLIHIEDVCEAFIFCTEQSSMKGRFMCVAVDPTISEMAEYFQNKNPKLKIQDGLIVEAEKGSCCDISKLKKMGFSYKYDMDVILNDSINCAKRFGLLQL